MFSKSAIQRLLLFSGLWCVALSESSDAQNRTRFLLHVPPSMSLQAQGPAQTANHPMTTADLIFPKQKWQAKTSSAMGSAVQFSSDHAFHNLSDANYKRDVRLQLTQISGSNGSGWQVDTVVDTTNYAAADETATVQVHSTGPGNAIIRMDVIFITGNLATLKGGQYQMTVVGTISEN